MNIKNIFFTVCLLLIICQTISAQNFVMPDSSCYNPVGYLKNKCYACSSNDSLEDCKVEEFGYLGNIKNKYYYYQISLSYDSANTGIVDSGYNTTNLVILEGDKSKSNVKSIYEHSDARGVIYFLKPDLVNTEYGWILHINMSSGNGGWDLGNYFIYERGKWYKLKTPAFLKAFGALIPKDYWFCRGSSIDLKNMTIVFRVFKKDDACCCPTGGIVKAKLKVTDNNEIIILNNKYFPDTQNNTQN